MTLEKSLYLFVCDDMEKLNAIYEGDKLMKKLMKENEDLLKDFDEMLYYDRDKMFENACYEKGYAKGKQEARQERNEEIVKEMLNKGMELQDIIDITGLTEKEIKEIA